jgi:hypothetical protein
MDGIEKLIRNWIEGRIGRQEFLIQLEQLKIHAREAIHRWWRFNEVECERRVEDNFSEAYSALVRKFLSPVLSRRVDETPEMRFFFKDVKPILLSDLYRRAEQAETIEDVYFILGDDLTHWLIIHLRLYLTVRQK